MDYHDRRITEHQWRTTLSPLVKDILQRAGLKKSDVIGERVKIVAGMLEDAGDADGAILLYGEVNPLYHS